MTALKWIFTTGLLVGLFGYVNRLTGGTDNQLLVPVSFFGLLGFTFLICWKEMGFQATMNGLRGLITGDKKLHKDMHRFGQVARTSLWEGALLITVLGFIHVFTVFGQGTDLSHAIAFGVVTFFYAGLLSILLPRDATTAVHTKHARGFSVIGVGAVAASLFVALWAVGKYDTRMGTMNGGANRAMASVHDCR